MGANKKGELIGQGKPAEVFAWGDTQALKLYRDGWSPTAVEQEARLIQIVHDAGLPVYNVSEVVQLEGRYGIILERIEGVSMQKMIEKSPGKFVSLAPRLGELHARIHAIPGSGLPPQRQILESKIRTAQVLNDQIKQRALDVLARLPDGDTLCHGDLHPDNIMMTRDGPIIIDWCQTTQGNPLADVANTIALIEFGVPEGIPNSRLMRWSMQWGRAWFRWLYLRRYLEMRAGKVTREELGAWELPALAAKVADFVPRDHQLWAFPEKQALMLTRIRQIVSDSISPCEADAKRLEYRGSR